LGAAALLARYSAGMAADAAYFSSSTAAVAAAEAALTDRCNILTRSLGASTTGGAKPVYTQTATQVPCRVVLRASPRHGEEGAQLLAQQVFRVFLPLTVSLDPFDRIVLTRTGDVLEAVDTDRGITDPVLLTAICRRLRANPAG